MSQKLRWKKITRLKETGAVVSNCILFMERMDYIDKAKARFLALNWVTNNGFIFFFFSFRLNLSPLFIACLLNDIEHAIYQQFIFVA